ncbi:MAG: type IV secretion system DNA-binding domain-containing protein [Chthoniobacter sp.]|nr:type IV secretion system DNA-binding domain-containing protein [Chthoniobacter sp.]
MSKLHDALNEQFLRWELRGRGWQVFEQPVGLEPPFRPFQGYSLPQHRPRDDGRRHSAASGFLASLRQQLTIPPTAAPPPEIPEPEPEPEFREPEEVVELQLTLPLSRPVPAPQVEQFLRHACRPGEPLALEILGTGRETVLQLVASPRAATRVRNAVETCFPGVVCAPFGDSDNPGEALRQAWHDSAANFAVVELGLAREFMLPLGDPRTDLLAAVAAAVDVLEKGELALLQILLEPAQAPWAGSIECLVINGEGKPFFADRADLVDGMRDKLASPLFAVVVRLVSSAAHTRRTWEIIHDMCAALSAVERPGSNYFVPLDDEGYPMSDHEDDILDRLSRRSGMLLSLEELIPLLTPPVAATARRLRRETGGTHAAPGIQLGSGTLSLGMNTHAGATKEIFLSPEHRVRHTHVIGSSGTGKSTMLLHLIRQDIEHGEGLAVFDPHGDLVDAVLGMIPPERVDDVILLDPSDEQFPVGLNILAAHSDFERNLLASDLTSIFRRLSTSWGDQMESVLRNAILAFLESSRGGTLVDLRRFLLDAAFRKEFLTTVTDPEIVFYWQRAFPQLTGGKSIGPVVTRLDEFLSRKPIRYMVSQDANRLDFAEILDRGHILLVRLPQGLIGRENTALLGSLVTAKLQMAAMSRQRLPAAQRRDFWCYMDEFQNFITPSMAEILAGARKYRIGLILAHQELRHLDADRDVASAVLSNCYTRVVFKVGDADARALESGFTHFEARDLMNLGVGEAVCRAERSDYDFNLAVPLPPSLDDAEAAATAEAVIASSRAKYARPRSEVEADLLRKWQHTPDAPAKPEKLQAPAPSAAPPPSPISIPPSVSEPPVEPAPPVVSETPPSVSAPEEITEPKPPVEIGRGKTLHRETQERIKLVAEDLGFRATKEGQVGCGSADVVLERDDHRIAVEFSSTTGVTHETQNILKCLVGDYTHIALVSADLRKLDQIAGKLREHVSETAFARVGFYEVEPFLDYLRSLQNPPASPTSTEPKSKKPADRKIMGWTVTTETRDQTPEEEAQAKAATLRALGEALRKPPQE